MDTAGILGKLLYWFIVLIFLVPAADALGVPAVSNALNELVAYLPAASQISTQQSTSQLGDGQQQPTADQVRQWQQTR